MGRKPRISNDEPNDNQRRRHYDPITRLAGALLAEPSEQSYLLALAISNITRGDAGTRISALANAQRPRSSTTP